VLQPSILIKAVGKALALLQATDEDPDTRRDELQKELRHIEAELARLTAAIAASGSMLALLSAVHDREERRTRLHAELATIEGVSFAHIDAVTIEQELRSYLMDWLSLAQQHPAQTRQILRKILPTASECGERSLARRSATTFKATPQSAGYSADSLRSKGLVSPTGFEPVLLP
jgi:hypothetical protein